MSLGLLECDSQWSLRGNSKPLQKDESLETHFLKNTLMGSIHWAGRKTMHAAKRESEREAEREDEQRRLILGLKLLRHP